MLFWCFVAYDPVHTLSLIISFFPFQGAMEQNLEVANLPLVQTLSFFTFYKDLATVAIHRLMMCHFMMYASGYGVFGNGGAGLPVKGVPGSRPGYPVGTGVCFYKCNAVSCGSRQHQSVPFFSFCRSRTWGHLTCSV